MRFTGSFSTRMLGRLGMGGLRGFHEELRRICFEQRTTMREVVIELLAKRIGKPMPKLLDKRKLTLEERFKLEKKSR